MSNQITMTASFDYMTIEKNGRSVELSIEQAWDLYYEIGEKFYGVHDSSDDWDFPTLRIAGENMLPTEIDSFLNRFSEALQDFGNRKDGLEERHRSEEAIKVDWRKEGF